MRLAVIPARGGSKRLPRKNVRTFRGRPMIAWSIDAARRSGVFDDIIVSTDDFEIAEVARSVGASVPFMRPAELSGDHVTTAAVIAHATRWCKENGPAPRAVCCIYATAPLMSPQDIARGLITLESGAWDFAFSAAEYRSSIFRAFRQLPGGGVEMYFPDRYESRTQDLPVALHDAAQFYWGRPEAWLEQRIIFGARSVPVVIPNWRVQDIDTEDDWQRAELLMSAADHGSAN
jgi:N-acylneuraminate cytidylyltransferase